MGRAPSPAQTQVRGPSARPGRGRSGLYMVYGALRMGHQPMLLIEAFVGLVVASIASIRSITSSP